MVGRQIKYFFAKILPSNMLMCLVVMWSCGLVVVWPCGRVVVWSCGLVVLWSCGLERMILIYRDTKCFCLYFLTSTVWRMIQRNTVHSMQYAVHSTQYAVHSIQYTVCSTRYTVCGTQYTGISCYVLIIEHLQHRILHVHCVIHTVVIILIFTPCISFVWSYVAEEDTVCIFTGDWIGPDRCWRDIVVEGVSVV
jgi:hypothetical protein